MSEGEEIKIEYIKKEDKPLKQNKIKSLKKAPKKITLITLLITSILITIFLIKKYNNLKKEISQLKIKKNEKKEEINLYEKNIKIFPPKIVPYKGEYHSESIVENILFPYKSNIIEDIKDIEFFRNNLGKVGLRLEYQASKHGDNYETFIKRTKIHYHHLLIIKTKTGKRFGGYISVNFNLPSLAGELIEVGKIDNSAFLFNLDSQKIYDVNKDVSAVYCTESVVCQFGGLDLIVPHNFFKNKGTSQFPFNYGNGASKLELTQGEKEFEISELEVFHVNFFSRDFYEDYEKKGRLGKEYNVFDY